MTTIDHSAVGLSRLATQFQGSPKLIAFLKTILSMSNEAESVLQSLLMLPDIDLMTGVNLDTIGIIVGIDRIVTNVVTLSFFGFNGFFYMTRFGEEGMLSIGSRFYEEGESFSDTTVLADPEYRMLIRSKITKNASRGTPEDIIWSLWYLVSGNEATTAVSIIDNEDMTIELGVNRDLTATEKAIITQMDILPRPVGVAITQVVTPSETITIPTIAGGL